MTEYFGAPELTMTEALLRNPEDMGEHLQWNASLIPSGLQLMLFGRIAGGVTPDYIEPIRDFWTATWLSVIVTACLVLGIVKTVWQPLPATKQWFSEKRWTMVAMSCYAAVALLVMVMQRPRAAYVFCFTIEIMGAVAFCLWRIAGSSRAASLLAKIAPVLIVSFIILTPPYYATEKHDRQLLNYVNFLQPLSLIIEFDNANVVMPKYTHEIAHYLYGTNISFEKRFQVPEEIPELGKPDTDYLKVLAEHNVKDIMFDQETKPGPTACERAIAAAPNWRMLAMRKLPDRTLSLYSMSKLYTPEKKTGF